jgi:hypothetical protein
LGAYFENFVKSMEITNTIPPHRRALAEALELSADILKNLELNDMPLQNIALKTSRLARLLNDFDFQKIMAYEASGYPRFPDGAPLDIWKLATQADRVYQQQDSKTKETKEYMYIESISEMEEALRIVDTSLTAARDPDISISSANPSQYVYAGVQNQLERNAIRTNASSWAKRLASRRNLIYQYALQKHYELKYSGIADDIFTRIRSKVDQRIGELVPDAVQKFTAVYENLQSENPENWANAVHSCRRILQDLADIIFPPSDEIRVVVIEGKETKIKLGKENYINRIIAFVQDKSNSERFEEIVGSNLGYLGDRLDSTFQAAQKGSHANIVNRDEADRYVVYTYMLVGDVLSLYAKT